MTESVTNVKKPMHLGAYIGLYIVTWIAGAFLANSISDLMGMVYTEATPAVIVGLMIGKRVMNNRRRDWSGIVAFPIITLIASLLGSALTPALNDIVPQITEHAGIAPMSIIISFALSCGLFGLSNAKQ